MTVDEVIRDWTRRFAPPRLGFWIVSAVPALMLLIGLGLVDIVPVLRIVKHGGTAPGIVESRACGDRKVVVYRYRVGDKDYMRKGRPKDTGIPCMSIKEGSALTVSFNVANPSESVPSSSPRAVLKRLLTALGIAMAAAYAGTMFAVWVAIRFGGLLVPRTPVGSA